jgi:hypothetical protein
MTQPKHPIVHAIDARRRSSRDGLYAPQYDESYGRRRGTGLRFNFPRCRINEIQKVIRHRHGVVPATDDADRYVWLVAEHMMQISPIRLGERLVMWASKWAPDMPKEQIEEIADGVLKGKGYSFGADRIAELLGVKEEEREALGITTIGAVDRLKAEREQDRVEKKLRRDREGAERRRREHGVLPRAEYLRGCLSQTQPWKAEGISERTWYRRRKRAADDAAMQTRNAGQVEHAAGEPEA